ncbi:hypothetical protein AGMMS49921_01920 [Endomicrobiia bacterium]|nr:hypothetical protein AGMMS49921_01920 [Endomicrobiia bacterium]
MMIGEAGSRFNELEPSAFDMSLGFKTDGGVIFGNSGGETEAVLRNVVDTKLDGENEAEQFSLVRGEAGVREVKINIGSRELKIPIVYGLKNMRKILRDIDADKTRYDFVEVMACPGGCVGGAGQPVYTDLAVRKRRTKALYENDKTMELHMPKDNLYVQKLYKDYLGEPGSKKAHEYLHTSYKYKKRFKETLEISDSVENNNIKVSVCFGNNCITKGSKEILKHIINFVEQESRKDKVDITVPICLEKYSKGPSIKAAGKTIEHCTTKAAEEAIRAELEKL